MNYTSELNRLTPAVIFLIPLCIHRSCRLALHVFFYMFINCLPVVLYASTIHVYQMSFHSFISNCRKKGSAKRFLKFQMKLLTISSPLCPLSVACIYPGILSLLLDNFQLYLFWQSSKTFVHVVGEVVGGKFVFFV